MLLVFKSLDYDGMKIMKSILSISGVPSFYVIVSHSVAVTRCYLSGGNMGEFLSYCRIF